MLQGFQGDSVTRSLPACSKNFFLKKKIHSNLYKLETMKKSVFAKIGSVRAYLTRISFQSSPVNKFRISFHNGMRIWRRREVGRKLATQDRTSGSARQARLPQPHTRCRRYGWLPLVIWGLSMWPSPTKPHPPSLPPSPFLHPSLVFS